MLNARNHNRKGISNVKGYIVPWTLPRENIPIHLKLPKDVSFDEIHIEIPNDFRFVDFLNVEEVKIMGQIAKIIKIIKPKSVDTPHYFGFVVTSTVIPNKLKIARNIMVKIRHNNKVVDKLKLNARIFRPLLEVTDAPKKIELTDVWQKFELPIHLKYVGFGDIRLKIEAEIRGRIVSHGESLIYELLRRLWLSDIFIKKQSEEKREKGEIYVEPPYLQKLSEELVKKIESSNMSDIFRMIDEKDIKEFKRWLSDVKTKNKFMDIVYSRIEDLLLDLLTDLLEKHPTDSVKLANARTKIKTKIELPVEVIKIRVMYMDSAGNEYPSVEVPIEIEDKRVENKKATIDIPIIIKKWEEEPFLNVAEMEIKEE